LILEVYSDFVGEEHFDIFGVTSAMIIGGIGVVSNGVVGGFPILRVHDSSIVIAFGGPLFDILTRVPYYRCNVTIGSINQEKIVSQVLGAFGVGSMD
jgi:hypothetical protein